MNALPTKGEWLGLAISPGVGIGLATSTASWGVPAETAGQVVAAIAELDEALPRWAWWDRTTADQLVTMGVAIDRCWDVLTVHRLINGGWKTSIGEAWASLHGLAAETIPTLGQMNLLAAPVDVGADPNNPILPDGHLRAEWAGGQWAESLERTVEWARLTVVAASAQETVLAQTTNDRSQSTARSESVADYLCAELAANGLPIDVAEAERIITNAAGPRPATIGEQDQIRAVRDREVLKHLSYQHEVNLRNPGEVKSMLRREGVDVEDTRAWRLEQLRDSYPIVEALLTWRKDERISTTYGYRWLDDHVSGGRLRGEWSSSDGAAGRMTASAGLHNLPSEMRSAIAADPGFCFVRSDLGQVEPRVLAAVSGDAAFIAATQADDLYQTVADQLGVERQVAKLAVLGAMYGATTGESAHVLPRLKRNYPVAMGLLDEAAENGRRQNDVYTSGGRRIRTNYSSGVDGDLDRARSAAESRGRFARNAIIQGAAAEFFKVWAVLVRRRARPFGAEVVLCLHDELLVHTPVSAATEVARVVEEAIGEAAHYWSPEPGVRFVAEVSTIDRWSKAKD